MTLVSNLGRKLLSTAQSHVTILLMNKSRASVKKKTIHPTMRTKRRKTKRLIGNGRRLFIMLIAIVSIGIIGSYYLLVSRAASYSAGVALYGWNPQVPAQAGQTYTFHWYVFVSNFGDLDPQLPFTARWTAGPGAGATNVSPTSGQFTVDSNFATNHSNAKDLYIQATSTSDCSVTERVTLTVYGKDGAQIASASQTAGPSGTGCPSDPTPTPTPNPNPNPNPNPGPNPNPNPNPGPGPNPNTSSSSSSARGGTSATRQGNNSNPLPSTSSQGTTRNQTKLEPSPFYDGRLYAPGSNSDGSYKDEGFGTFLATGTKKVVEGAWPYALGTVFVVSAGLVIYWRVYRKR